MKKFFASICLMVFILMSMCNLPALAEKKNGFSYNSNPYWAKVKYGVNFRDKNGNIIRYLDEGTKVYVLGGSDENSELFVVEYNGKMGTVIKSGVRKSSAPSSSSSSSSSNSSSGSNGQSSNTGLSYRGSSYYGKVKNWLNVRDAENNVIGKITRGEVVKVLGTWTGNSDRVVIERSGARGTVLKSGLTKVSAPTSTSGGSSNSSTPSYSGKSYYAVTRSGVNMRNAKGDIIYKIPTNALVYVKGTDTKDKDRVIVKYNGHEGSILNSVKAVNNAVFISIGSQKVTLIRDGKLIAESKCVTGMKDRSDTPKGKFSIIERAENRTLRGKNYDGSSYAQPVKYWMCFSGNCGLHDAKWRSSFGGSIYKKNGSHGCVNLPSSFAKTLYNNTYKGMPVYVF